MTTVAGIDDVDVGGTCRAIKWAVPLALSRTTKMSVSIASSVRTVSRMVSPFFVDKRAVLRLITDAPKRFPAISKVVRVPRAVFKKKIDHRVVTQQSSRFVFISGSLVAKCFAVSKILSS